MSEVARGEFNRDAVARATWTVVARSGLNSASMREIAREAGCTTGVLTHYFRDKDELLLFAFTLAFESAAARMHAQATEHEDPVDALLAVLEEGLPLDDQRRLESATYFGFLDVARRKGPLAEEFRRRHWLWRELVAGQVRRTGAVASRATPDVADLLLVAVDGIASSALADPVHFSPKRQRVLLRRSIKSLLGNRR